MLFILTETKKITDRIRRAKVMDGQWMAMDGSMYLDLRKIEIDCKKKSIFNDIHYIAYF